MDSRACVPTGAAEGGAEVGDTGVGVGIEEESLERQADKHRIETEPEKEKKKQDGVMMEMYQKKQEMSNLMFQSKEDGRSCKVKRA